MKLRSLPALVVAVTVMLSALPLAAASTVDRLTGFSNCYYLQKAKLENGTNWTLPDAGKVHPDFFTGCVDGVIQANAEHAAKPKPTPPTDPNAPTNPTPPQPPPTPPADTFWLILRPNEMTAELRRGTANEFHTGFSMALLNQDPPEAPAGDTKGLGRKYEVPLKAPMRVQGAQHFLPLTPVAAALSMAVRRQPDGAWRVYWYNLDYDWVQLKPGTNHWAYYTWRTDRRVYADDQIPRKTGVRCLPLDPNPVYWPRLENDELLVNRAWFGMHDMPPLVALSDSPYCTISGDWDPVNGAKDGQAVAIRVRHPESLINALGATPVPLAAPAPAAPVGPGEDGSQNEAPPSVTDGGRPPGQGNTGATTGGTSTGLWSENWSLGGSTGGSGGAGSTGNTGATTGGTSTGLWSENWSLGGSTGGTGNSTGGTTGGTSTGLWSENWSLGGSTGGTGATTGGTSTGLWSENWSLGGSTGGTGNTGATTGGTSTGLWSENWSLGGGTGGSGGAGNTGNTGATTGGTSTGLWSENWSLGGGTGGTGNTGATTGTTTTGQWSNNFDITVDQPEWSPADAEPWEWLSPDFTTEPPPSPEPEPEVDLDHPDALHYAAVFVNDEFTTSVAIPSVAGPTVTTVEKSADFYLALNPDGTVRAIWTILNVMPWSTMPINIEYRGTYTANPFRATLELQPAPKGWETLLHEDPSVQTMIVTGKLSADRTRILDLNIMDRQAMSGEAWQTERTPGPGRP